MTSLNLRDRLLPCPSPACGRGAGGGRGPWEARQQPQHHYKTRFTMQPASNANRSLAITALLAGATCIGTSALWVKVSEAGPVSTAFWRVFLALPFLWAWAWWAGRGVSAPASHSRGLLFGAGFFFAGDLAVWHWSIVLTSVANATLLANLAPIFVLSLIHI